MPVNYCAHERCVSFHSFWLIEISTSHIEIVEHIKFVKLSCDYGSSEASILELIQFFIDIDLKLIQTEINISDILRDNCTHETELRSEIKRIVAFRVPRSITGRNDHCIIKSKEMLVSMRFRPVLPHPERKSVFYPRLSNELFRITKDLIADDRTHIFINLRRNFKFK